MARDVQVIHTKRPLRGRYSNSKIPLKLLIIIIALALIGIFIFLGSKLIKNKPLPMAYSVDNPQYGIEQSNNHLLAKSFASDLCVVDKNVVNKQYAVKKVASAVLFGTDDLSTLYAKSAFKKVYPASLTKVMTALVTLKNANLKDKVKVTPLVNTLAKDSSKANIKAGDVLTVEQLLYGLMLPSGGDAAVALAQYVGGSVDHFVDMMNAEALSLGATGTHYVNVHGLQNEEQYTTAYDMYLIFNEAIKNENFIRIISTPTYICNYKNSENKSAQLTFTNTNRYLTGGLKTPPNIMMIGGKTGFTFEAGRCLILLTKDENSSYISAIFKAQDINDLYGKMDLLLKDISS